MDDKWPSYTCTFASSLLKEQHSLRMQEWEVPWVSSGPNYYFRTNGKELEPTCAGAILAYTPIHSC